MSLRWVARAADLMTGNVRRTTNSTPMPFRWGQMCASDALTSRASEQTGMNTNRGMSCCATTLINDPTRCGTPSTIFNLTAIIAQHRQISTRSVQFRAATDDSSPSERNPLSQVPLPKTEESETVVGTPSSSGLGKARAFLKNAAISPRKLKEACDLVRFLPVEHALIQCQLSPKKACAIAYKVIKSAEANAIHNHGLIKARLVVAKIKADKGQYMKRIEFRARGKTGLINKYRAHLEVVLEEHEDVMAKVPEEKRLTIRKDYGPRKHRKYSDAHGPAKLWV